MQREQIKELALANGFNLKPQPDGREDLNPYVYEFAQALVDALLPKASPGCFEVPRMSEEFELPVDCHKGHIFPGEEEELHLFGDQAVAGAYAINNHDSIRAASLMSARDTAALAEERDQLRAAVALAIDTFEQYQMDVDTYPPVQHVALMQNLDGILAKHDAEVIRQTFSAAYRAGFDHGLKCDQSEIESANRSATSISLYEYQLQHVARNAAEQYIRQQTEEAQS